VERSDLKKGLRASPTCAARPLHQELRNVCKGNNSSAVWSEATLKKGLRASPTCAASPTHQELRNVCKGNNSSAVWSEATKEKDGLRKQAVEV
jgi:hypothetical protein